MTSRRAPARMDFIASATSTVGVALLPLLAALSTTACVGEGQVAAVDQPLMTENSLTSNALTSSALTESALTSKALTENALTSSALMENPLTRAALNDDPLARQLLRYIVSCALPAGASIDLTLDGTPYSFAGELGLAPAWGEPGRTCDERCRSWVSGCVLSRVNYLGEPVSISLRGSLHALEASAEEEAAYPNREAAYFGDIFSVPQVRYACVSPGSSLISRVCGPSSSDCVMDVLGDCPDFCRRPRHDGSYPACGPDKHTRFLGSVTVFRQ